MAAKWEYKLELCAGASSGHDFINKFKLEGEDGWEYAGTVEDAGGVKFYVWKRELA
jgi:hypothetical protein